jgi:cytochrome c oxidase cbb3-type subunit 3
MKVPGLARNSLLPLSACLFVSLAFSAAQTPAVRPARAPKQSVVAAYQYSPALVESGKSLFQQRCAFCHGRDAGGGETGPDLTRSALVANDVNGSKIGAVVRNGRPDKGMPHFEFSERQLAGLASFIHVQQKAALANKGGRRGVDAEDLRTGNAESGKKYFEGPGKCSTCHSASGDLAGIASRYQGLKLEEQMLYPRHAKAKVTVTLASGETVSGTLEYLDEFTVGLFDPGGTYRSWRIRDVKYEVSAPEKAHAGLLSQYTDDDIHNLMAYLQTLR